MRYAPAYRFPAMIQDWRQKWYEGTGALTNKQFPFGFVQLAAWTNTPLGPTAIRWGLGEPPRGP
jgi:sialate O-acetylesterase